MKKQKILVCEDECDSREAIKNILTKRNYEVYTAKDGKESIEKAREIKPHLLILDIRMPKIDGIEVVKEIRRFDTKVKIIFLTAFQSPQLSKEAAKYNIYDYIVKPPSPHYLIKAVGDALKQKKS